MNPLWLSDPRAFSNDDFHPEAPPSFTALDYVALALFLLASLGVGVAAGFFGKKDKEGQKQETDTEEFLMGSRQLSLIPVALSLLVSFNSAIVTLGGPAEIYFNGTMYIWSMLGELFASVIASFLFVPVLYNLRLTSSFEYLEMRFKSRLVRIAGNILLLLNNVIYMGIALYAPAIALNYVSNGAIDTVVAIIVSGLICTAYTTWGGIKAVIWTDVFQSVIMMAGVLGIIIRGLIDIGGLGNAWNIAEKYGRIEFDNFSPDPRQRHTFWGLIFANAIAYSSTFGVSQASVQRYCGLTSVRKAQISVILACTSASIFVFSTSLCGLVIFAFYASVGCDPSASGRISDTNQLVPYYVMEKLNVPFVPGLFVASLFAGALSSVSSSLSALSATTWQDLLKPYIFKDASERKATWINRITVLLFGFSALAMGVVSIYFGGTVLQASLTFTGSFGAPILGLFALGIVVPFVEKNGALVGAVVGLAVSAWISVGSYIHGKQLVGLPTNTSRCYDPNITTTTVMTTTGPTTPPVPFDDWYSISYVWYTLIGAGTTMVCGMIVSGCVLAYRRITGRPNPEDENVDAALLNPYFMRLYELLCGCCGVRSGVVHPIDDGVEMTKPEAAEEAKAVKDSGDAADAEEAADRPEPASDETDESPEPASEAAAENQQPTDDEDEERPKSVNEEAGEEGSAAANEEAEDDAPPHEEAPQTGGQPSTGDTQTAS